MKENLIHSRTCVYNINYHIVWSVKYRRKIISNEMELHSLPFDKIYSMLQYKLALCGIMLIKQNEAYSSQCSPNSAKVGKTSADKKNRKKRGCYFENNNLYNADAVGAYNIGRLAMQECKISKFDIQTKTLSSPKKVAV